MYNYNYTDIFCEQLRLVLTDLPKGRIFGEVLCINPREGDIPLTFRDKRKHSVSIDSFVSDSEWTEAALRFSRTVVSGRSHHPLKRTLPEGNYDLVIVCEDFSRVDDCDRMAQTYYTLLKPGGRLVAGIWNLSYHKALHSIINAKPVNENLSDSQLLGSQSIPIDTLMSRLSGIGFSRTKLEPISGEEHPINISDYIKISKKFAKPLDRSRLLTLLYFFSATK